MKECPKCQMPLSNNEVVVWKCRECGKTYKLPLDKLIQLPTIIKADGTPLIKCSNCGNGLHTDEKVYWKCGVCGYVLAGSVGKICKKNKNADTQNKINEDTKDYRMCPKCGCKMEKEQNVCSQCGNMSVMKNDNYDSETDIQKHGKKYIGLIFGLIALVCFIWGITRISNDEYNFYKEHYETCMEGYAESKQIANSYSSSFFKNSYNSIASSYENMAEDDNEKIWEFRIQAIILCICGVFFISIGYKIYQKGTLFTRLNNSEYIQKRKQKKGKTVIWVAICGVAILGIYYYGTRCSYSGCNAKKTEASKYCYYHKYVWSYNSYDYDYDYTPQTGNSGALAEAKSYLKSTAFSYTGLIEQLEYEGFSESEAKYGADNCGANWKEQALKKAKSYLKSSAFSYSGLIDQLEYNGFTNEQAKYGVDNCGANWKEQASKKAKSYLETFDFTRSELIDQLLYNGFTHEQAIYGAEQNGF